MMFDLDIVESIWCWMVGFRAYVQEFGLNFYRTITEGSLPIPRAVNPPSRRKMAPETRVMIAEGRGAKIDLIGRSCRLYVREILELPGRWLPYSLGFRAWPPVMF